MNDNKKFWQRFAKLYSPFMEKGNKQTYEQICAEVSPYLNKETTEGAGYHIRIKLMNLVGFKTYSKWNADELTDYIEKHGFEVLKKPIMGSNLAPLCCLIVRKSENDTCE